ncbi:PTS glucose transporter subunit IIA [Actinotalea sp.]|uniref:PTS sugar transporter subunit IIA n=1 Tax=Actinotalea sp. TaxID=1872145 RepID=UPI003562C486
MAGILTALDDVPDPVFAEAMVGPGVAVLAEDGPGLSSVTAVAPVSGTLVTVHPHAFVVLTAGGRAVLVHLGIDTVRLKGEGFTVHAEVGTHRAVGDPVVTWSPRAVAESGLSTLVPVVALDAGPGALHVEGAIGSRVGAGQSLFVWS